jgi:ring-1,2-phenylacetyl-CoA epoxidase subunit PaaE
MSHSHAADIDSIKRIPDPAEPPRRIARPTVALFIAALAVWSASTTLAVTGVWPWPVSTVLNTFAAFALFTVGHDATHNSLSTIAPVNTWLGRVALYALSPQIGFRAFRYIHMQHHRFTNHDDGRDPDHYTMRGPTWQAPLRWLTLDLSYAGWYWAQLRTRPRGELQETVVMLLLFAVVIAALVLSGNFLLVGLACWLVPARLAVLMLGWSFDYLPHHGLKSRPTDDRFQTTRNRIGLERLLTPLMLYQNYHLVHHLHPVIPFYRYIAVWRRNERDYLQHEPALSTVGGRPLTADEYRALRELNSA